MRLAPAIDKFCPQTHIFKIDHLKNKWASALQKQKKLFNLKSFALICKVCHSGNRPPRKRSLHLHKLKNLNLNKNIDQVLSFAFERFISNKRSSPMHKHMSLPLGFRRQMKIKSAMLRHPILSSSLKVGHPCLTLITKLERSK